MHPTSSPAQAAPPAVAAYTADEQALHKLFPQLPLNEKLVENYQCGLSRKKIVRMGRLYLTSLRLCFHSTFLSENLMLEWESIAAVEKKDNFVFEAVIVKTLSGESHYFSAFMYGMTDQAHKMMTMLWSVRRKYAGSVSPATALAAPVRVIHARSDSTASAPSTVASSTINRAATGEDAVARMSPQHQQQTSAASDANADVEVVAGELEQAPAVTNDGGNVPMKRSDTASPAHDVAATVSDEGTGKSGGGNATAAPPVDSRSASLATSEEAQHHAAAACLSTPPSPSPMPAVTPAADDRLTPTPRPPVQSVTEQQPSSLDSDSLLQATDRPTAQDPQLANFSMGRSSGCPSPATADALQRPHSPSGLKVASEPPQPQPLPQSPGQPQPPTAVQPLVAVPSQVLPGVVMQAAAPAPAVSAALPPRADRRAEKAIARASVVPEAPHDILKHFPLIPKSETVVDSFQCSYVVGVHRLGKLYITANYILFSSVMLSEAVSLKFSDITSIEKEQTMVILDGVTIATRSGAVHNFTSFVNRDAAFSILQHFFAAHRTRLSTRDRLKDTEAAPAVSGDTATPSGLTAQPAVERVDVPPPPLSSGESISKPTPSEKAALPAKVTRVLPNHRFRTSCAEPNFGIMPKCNSIQEFSRVQTDYGTGLSDVSNFMAKRIVPAVPFPEGWSIFDVFRECFDDETSLLDQYHEQRRDTGRTWEAWRPAVKGSLPMSGQRKLLCTTIIRAVTSKACPFTEFQRFGFLNVNGSPHLLVQFSGQAVGVMFSDSFRAETLLVFSQPNIQTPRVSVEVYGYIQFLRNVWVKGKILSTALDVEMPECYRTLTSMSVTRVASSVQWGIVEELPAEDPERQPLEASSAPTASASAPLSPLSPNPSSSAPSAPAAPAPAMPPVAAINPPATSTAAALVMLACYGLALLCCVQGLWAVYWSSPRVVVSASDLSTSVQPDAALQPLHVTLDVSSIEVMLRPLTFVALLIASAIITGRFDALLATVL